uniref:TRAF3-interacting protein 1 n=1 Tax=Caenorhabditis tropicalis TaxID=1561998 RepID=A0A1I7U7H9_9PELO
MSVEKTQEILAHVITQPTLTSQLLSRPPFKFIVDINEFSSDELKSAGSDKNTKTAFLEKLIKILDDGSLKNVKAAKVVAGKDAEETNKMLQKLGTNASNFSKNGGEEKKRRKVKRRQKGGINSKKKKKDISEKTEKPEQLEKAEKTSKSEKSEKKEKENKKPSSSEEKKKRSSSKERHKSSERERSTEKSNEKKEKKKTEKSTNDAVKPKKSKKDPSERLLKRQDSMIAVNGDAPDTPTNDSSHDDGFDEQESPKFTNLESENGSNTFLAQHLNPPTVDDNKREESPNLIKLEDRLQLARPMTGAAGGRPMTSMGRPGTAASRPAPPKLKKKQIATVDATPQTVVELKSEIISEAIPSLNLEEDNNFIMENDEEDGEKTARISELIDEQDRGALVQKIMETKAGIEDSGTVDQEMDSEADKILSVEKERVRQLQEKLQDLTRAAYPLARLFDFASDDIESMIKELERWRVEQRKNEQEEQNKKASGFGDSSRLYNMIASLQKDINEKKEELSKARGRVLNNDKKIQLFISNV